MDVEVATIDKYGRVVIPAAMRRSLGLRGGDEVILRSREDHLELVNRRAAANRALTRLQRAVAQSVGDRDLIEELINERRWEAEKG